jgi:hypothetical protein
MLAVFSSVNGAIFISWLPPREKFSSGYFCERILERLSEILHNRYAAPSTRSTLHFDNAARHRSAVIENCCESCQFRHDSKPRYSPDISPCYFFLFDNLKRKRRNFRFIQMARGSLTFARRTSRRQEKSSETSRSVSARAADTGAQSRWNLSRKHRPWAIGQMMGSVPLSIMRSVPSQFFARKREAGLSRKPCQKRKSSFPMNSLPSQAGPTGRPEQLRMATSALVILYSRVRRLRDMVGYRF